ncbi:hypothetical protein ACOMHN_005006 [Nucella lapillus]
MDKSLEDENLPYAEMMDPFDEDEGDASTGDKLQIRLLLSEGKERSEVMWRQLTAFQEKVTLCLNTFNPEKLLLHLRSLASLPNQNSILVSSIHSLARLRMVVQQQLRRASMRSDGSIYFTAEQESSVIARCTQYFVWFFDFMDYLNELHSNFVERIFLPLFRFFHEISFLGSQSRASTSGSTFSKLSQFSHESGDTEENDNTFNGGSNGSEADLGEGGSVMEVNTVRRRAQSKTALMLLSKEFADIRTLYDTTDVDRVAQRLSSLKDQVDFMLAEEDELEPDLFSMESGQLLYHLQMDEGTENLVRLPLDLLIKFRKAVWLARHWLELYDKRTHDLNTKLEKVLTLENNLNRRLRSLNGDIVQREQQLERQTGELHRLMSREERSEALHFTLYDLEAKSKTLKQQLDKLRKQREAISTKILNVTHKGQAHMYRAIKMEFEKNKLQRYLIERQLATINYQRQLSEQDRNVELQVRPSLIRYTNHVQDTCERLEQTIHQQKQDRDNIRCALLPIQEDRQMLRDKLSRGSFTRGGSNSSGKPGLRTGEAKFVRTHTVAYRHDPKPAPVITYRPPKPRAVPGWMSPPQW